MDKLQRMVEMQKFLLGLNGILSDPYFFNFNPILDIMLQYIYIEYRILFDHSLFSI